MNRCIEVRKKDASDVVVALVGNPNVGKSTVFNALTGLKQHTGNWPGKTVSIAQGRYSYKGKGYILVDLPGTYSLISQSEEERVAADFIQSGQADCTVVLADATCLERTLMLALQVMELTDRVIVCINLLDEAMRNEIQIDLGAVERALGVPVVGAAAGSGIGLDQLREKIRNLADGFLPVHPHRITKNTDDLFMDWNQRQSDQTAELFARRTKEIVQSAVTGKKAWSPHWLDRIVLGRISGYVVLLLLLFGIFWLTMKGANYPSALLETWFGKLEQLLKEWTMHWPQWLSGLFVDGVYHTMSCVVAVMLPPLLIFFPLFTLLEDLGYLPRAAFLMDHRFEMCGSCGKQALTMAMGFGCNAAGVMGARIIASPRERLLAILTNSLVPCNGRFPAMIVLISVFFSDHDLLAALILTALVLLGILMTFLTTKILSGVLRQEHASQMILELPRYRKPNWRKILVQSLGDRVAFVLSRAIAISAPAGAMIWLLQQMQWDGMPFLLRLAEILEPLGIFLGMNGTILVAFLLSFPANELLLPSIAMLIQGTAASAGQDIGSLLLANGWTARTAICTLIFLLFHWPCGTTCLTIQKETSSWKWTLVSICLPLLIGLFLCSLVARL